MIEPVNMKKFVLSYPPLAFGLRFSKRSLEVILVVLIGHWLHRGQIPIEGEHH
jgi:hypothetical protein